MRQNEKVVQVATHGQHISGPDRSGLANKNRLYRKLPTINEDIYLFENESELVADEVNKSDRDDDVNLIFLSIPEEEEDPKN